MKVNCTFELPEDFRLLCEIFAYQPQQVLQRFMEEVSFPVFFSQPNNDHRWATLFFLYNMGAANDELADKWEEHEVFMDRMMKAILEDPKNGEESCRKIISQWHQSVLRKRADDILDKFSDES